MDTTKKPYEKLEGNEKTKLWNTTLDLLAYKPSLIGDVSTYAGYLDKIEEFAKTLYERLPEFERKGGITRVDMVGL